MSDTTPATGPALAAALGGTFDFDNATIRFVGRSIFVRCAFTGRVTLWADALTPITIGTMSDGVEAIVARFADAFEMNLLP